MTETKCKDASTLEVEVRIKALDRKSGKVIEVFDANAKAIKSNTPDGNILIKDNMEIKIDGFKNDDGFEFPNVFARAGSKLTKADSGKA